MMIVASNNITLSNVNDGTTVHIAYANSADGTDGFYIGGGRNYLVNSGNFSNTDNWDCNNGGTISVQDGCLSLFQNNTSIFRGVAQVFDLSPNDLGINFTATTVAKIASDSTAKNLSALVHFIESVS